MNNSAKTALAAALLVVSACGDDPVGGNGGTSPNAGNSQNAGNAGENAGTYPRGGPALDTSAFTGTAMWLTNTAGLTVDLAENAESEFTVDVNPDGQDLGNVIVHIEADLSADAGSVAYVRQSSAFCPPAAEAGGFMAQFGKLTVVSGATRTDLPVETPEGVADCRSVRSASISADGSAVAFSYRYLDVDTNEEEDIAVWDLNSEPVVITDSEAKDYYPMISADGSRVAFLSDRDAESELFIAPADGTGEPTKVSVEHPDFDGPHLFGTTKFPECSDDLSVCAFVHGSSSEVRAAYVVDTASGAVTRLGLQSGVGSVSLSGDGSTAAITVATEAPLVANIHIIDVSVADDGSVIGSMTEISALLQPPALNTDGSLLLVVNQEQGGSQFGEPGGLFNVSVWRTDGSERAMVESDETDDRFFGIGNMAIGIR